MTFTVHIDGQDMLPYLTGKVESSPRQSFFYISDDGDVLAIRDGDWKFVLMEQRAKQMAAAEAAAEAERKRQAELAARPRIAFSRMLGQLPYPAQGQILRRFGDNDGLGAKLRGFAVATRAEAQVTSPADGKIEFSGPFRSYGQLLIIDAGEGHLILLAGMERISAEMGQVVRAGEPVAQMGKGPSSVTLLGDMMQEKRPVLYVELRKDGEAIDSAPWWIGGMREASR